MNEYWLVIDDVNKNIEICFPDRKKYLINALMATLNYNQLNELKDKLDNTDLNTPPYVCQYEYGSLDINPEYIMVNFNMFDDESSCYLYTDVYREALSEYLQEFDKLRDNSKGLSK